MNTPWGKALTVRALADGITRVTTAKHGGIKLDRKRNAKIPEYMRLIGGWYEEDCDWAIPFVVFEADILAANPDDFELAQTIRERAHHGMLRTSRPGEYERFTRESSPKHEFSHRSVAARLRTGRKPRR